MSQSTKCQIVMNHTSHHLEDKTRYLVPLLEVYPLLRCDTARHFQIIDHCWIQISKPYFAIFDQVSSWPCNLNILVDNSGLNCIIRLYKHYKYIIATLVRSSTGSYEDLNPFSIFIKQIHMGLAQTGWMATSQCY
jgi:hypothetical protein